MVNEERERERERERLGFVRDRESGALRKWCGEGVFILKWRRGRGGKEMEGGIEERGVLKGRESSGEGEISNIY